MEVDVNGGVAHIPGSPDSNPFPWDDEDDIHNGSESPSEDEMQPLCNSPQQPLTTQNTGDAAASVATPSTGIKRVSVVFYTIFFTATNMCYSAETSLYEIHLASYIWGFWT